MKRSRATDKAYVPNGSDDDDASDFEDKVRSFRFFFSFATIIMFYELHVCLHANSISFMSELLLFFPFYLFFR